MLQASSGEAARPTTGRDWATWLEEAIGRVADCNARLAKEKRRARGTRVRSYTKKIQLAEIQLQSDPANVEVRGLLSEAQGQLAEEFQDSVARNRHLSSASWLRSDQIARAQHGPRHLRRQLDLRGAKAQKDPVLNVEEHCRSMAEGLTWSNEGNPDQHRGSPQATNLRQPLDSQPVRSPARTERHKRGEHLCVGWLHANQRPLEPSRTGVEKPGRARNELPCGEQKMQGDLHCQHSMAYGRRSHPSKKQGLD
ncbi:unnamed protein product [Sphagnum jensenii]|uniref:Uncharacterized protein n=1 Tax=Sphagnum jensenii TaxID=128206 RepID=A0ABP0W848_9BRYO